MKTDDYSGLVGITLNGVKIKPGILGEAVARAKRDVAKRNPRGEGARKSEMRYYVAKHLVLLSGGKMR